MRRLRLRFLLLALVLLVPVGLLIQRTLASVRFERAVRHEAVAERIFDEMERALSGLLAREEERPFGHYRFLSGPDGDERSPLSTLSDEPFIVGGFQVDPDGALYTPLRPRAGETARLRDGWHPSEETLRAVDEIERVVGGYWAGRVGGDALKERAAAPAPALAADADETGPFPGFAQSPGTTLPLLTPAAEGERGGRARAESDEVSVYDALRSLNKGIQSRANRRLKVLEQYAAPEAQGRYEVGEPEGVRVEALEPDVQPSPPPGGPAAGARVRVEVAPMVGRVVDGRHMLLYRTVLVGGEGYRQGLLLTLEELHGWLERQGLGSAGLGQRARLRFSDPFAAPPTPSEAGFGYRHRFAEPFDDLGVTLLLAPLPGVGGAGYVYALSALLLLVGGLGLYALYRMVEVALRFSERRSQFAAAVSHELKTPLTAIRMYGEMLRDDLVPSEDKRHEYYRSITVESERLGRLINNVLEFSRLEKGTRELSLVAGRVEPVLEEIAELLRPHVEREGFELRVEADPDLPAVRFDRDGLVQVVFNLVDNALKYARAGEPRCIALRCEAIGGELRIGVRDSGPGVAPRQLSRIFEPFYRPDPEPGRRSQGTGIGLALVRSLAEQMGARVSARNLEPAGFEVQIAFEALPAAD